MVQPSMARERVWGSRAYVTIPLEVRSAYHDNKLYSLRGWLGYFVGSESESVYRIWDPERLRGSSDGDSNDEPDYERQDGPPRYQDSEQENMSEQDIVHQSQAEDAEGSEVDTDDGFFESDDNAPTVSKYFDRPAIAAIAGRVKQPILDEDLPQHKPEDNISPIEENDDSGTDSDEYPDEYRLDEITSNRNSERVNRNQSRMLGVVPGRVPDDRKCDYCMQQVRTCNDAGIPCVLWKMPKKHEHRSKATAPLGKGICKMCKERKRDCNGDTPCNHCLKENTECIPGARRGVRAEDKCYRCYKQQKACNGERPCNSCEDDNITCVPQSGVEKCTRCRGLNVKCDGGKPCARCVRSDEGCLYQTQFVRRVYNDKTADVSEDAPECNTCRIHNLLCTGTEPCWRCIKHRNPTCGYRREGRVSEFFKVDPFHLVDDMIELRHEDSDKAIEAGKAFREVKDKKKKSKPKPKVPENASDGDDYIEREEASETLDADLAEVPKNPTRLGYAAAVIGTKPHL
ncbi:MAG: hypothetical protein Q9174_006550, partial [Haloplaca sp. 1 TL-2023]